MREALSLTLSDQEEKALEILDQLLSADPHDVEALRLKGNILEMLGAPMEARWCYEAIGEVKPDDVRTLIDIGDTFNFSEDSDDIDTALAFYDRAIDWLNKGHFSESLEEEWRMLTFVRLWG